MKRERCDDSRFGVHVLADLFDVWMEGQCERSEVDHVDDGVVHVELSDPLEGFLDEL